MTYTFTRTGPEIEAIHETVSDPSTNQGFTDEIGEIVTPKYTDIVYKSSGVDSAVDKMLSDFTTNPLVYEIGTILKTGGTTWEYLDSTGPITIENFRAFNAICVLDFGAKNNATAVGQVVTGDDSYSQITAAIQAAVDLKASTVYLPEGGYYSTQKIVLPSNIKLVGDGRVYWGRLSAGLPSAGTVIYIDGDSNDVCLEFEENTGYNSIEDMLILNTGEVDILSVVSIVGSLYPSLRDVGIQSNAPFTTGSALLIAKSNTGSQFETLWGDFKNVIIEASNRGVKTGLQVNGTSLANNFDGGQITGWNKAMQLNPGVTGFNFSGVKFDSNWLDIAGQEAADVEWSNYLTYGGGAAGAHYIHPIIDMQGTLQINFSGCYIEQQNGFPTTWDDGVHGVLPVFPVLRLGDDARNTDIVGMSWHSAYLQDRGQGNNSTTGYASEQNPGIQTNSRQIPHLAGRPSLGTPQVLPFQTPTSVNFGNFGSYLGDDAVKYISSGTVQFFAEGDYLYTATVRLTGLTPISGRNAYLTLLGARDNGASNISGDLQYTRTGETIITLTLTTTIGVARGGFGHVGVGDTVNLQVYQGTDTDCNIDINTTTISVMKVN